MPAEAQCFHLGYNRESEEYFKIRFKDLRLCGLMYAFEISGFSFPNWRI